MRIEVGGHTGEGYVATIVAHADMLSVSACLPPAISVPRGLLGVQRDEVDRTRPGLVIGGVDGVGRHAQAGSKDHSYEAGNGASPYRVRAGAHPTPLGQARSEPTDRKKLALSSKEFGST